MESKFYKYGAEILIFICGMVVIGIIFYIILFPSEFNYVLIIFQGILLLLQLTLIKLQNLEYGK